VNVKSLHFFIQMSIYQVETEYENMVHSNVKNNFVKNYLFIIFYSFLIIIKYVN
jgi:hypothetical protein